MFCQNLMEIKISRYRVRLFIICVFHVNSVFLYNLATEYTSQKKNKERKHYYYYYNSSLALNLKQCYSKRFTVHKIQYTCTIKHISRIDKMR